MHDAVQRTVPRRGGLHHPGHFVLVGDVGGLVPHRTRAVTGLRLDLVPGGGQPVGVAADEHRVTTRRDDRRGDTLADTAATTGDDEGSIRQRKLHHCPFTERN